MGSVGSQLRPAVFLDRDGTLIEDSGFLGSPEQVVFLPQTFHALRRLAERFALFIVTNQPGISRGDLSVRQVEQVNQYVVDRLAEAGAQIRQVYVCPHQRTEVCRCIKPNPHFLLEAAREHGIDLARSYVVGDHPHDVELAQAVGATGLYVRTGHGMQHLDELPAGRTVLADIGEAADWILAADWAGGAWRGDLPEAVETIRRGGLVAFPTETVYGLGADVFNVRAVERIYQVKGRPAIDPLIVHVADLDQVDLLTEGLCPAGRELARCFWPGPLTLVLARRPAVADRVTAGLPTVAVRMPRHPVAIELIRRAGCPVTAPSANRFGQVSPTTAEHVRQELGDAVDVILDGGPCSVGVESTIVRFDQGRPVILRPGGISVEMIEAAVGPARVETGRPDRPMAPGALPRHYAPRTPLVFGRPDQARLRGRRAGLLTLRPPADPSAWAAVEVLSARGDLAEAAANLYAAIRRLDALALDLIVAEPVEDRGLGRTINDRLRRASHPADKGPTEAP